MPESFWSERPPCDAERWARLWAHRESLLKVARPRVPAQADAEDVVSEALLRAAADASVDIETAGAWMNRVVMNLCVDRHREAGYDRNRLRYAVRHAIPVASPEDEVCDRAEAAMVGRHVSRLPERQRHAVLLRAAGHDVGSIATQMQTEYKAVESLLSRARRSLRAVATAVVALFAVVGRSQRGTRVAVTAAAAVTVVAVGVSGPSPLGSDAGTPSRAGAAAPVAGAASASRPAPRLAPKPVAARPAAAVAVRPRPVRPAVARTHARPAIRVMPKRQVRTRLVSAEAPGIERRNPDEDTLTSVRRCLDEGVVVSETYVGCRAAS